MLDNHINIEPVNREVVVDLRSHNQLPELLDEFIAVRELKCEADKRERELKKEFERLAGTTGEATLLAADGRKLSIGEYTRNISAKAAYIQNCKSFTVE